MYLDQQIDNGGYLKIIETKGCLQQKLNQNVFMIDEDQCLYINGKSVVTLNLITKKQKFATFDFEDCNPTAFATNQKNELSYAVAFNGISNPYIKIIYNGVKIKLFHDFTSQISQILDIIFFGPQGKLLLSLSNHIAVYNYKDQGKLLGYQELNFQASGLLKNDDKIDSFIIWGPSHIKEFTFNEREQFFSEENYNTGFLIQNEIIIGTCFQYSTGYLAFITTQNFLYYTKFRLLEQKFFLNPYNQNEKNNQYQVSCIVSLPRSNRFCIGFAGLGRLMIVNISNDSKISQESLHNLNFQNIFRILNMNSSKCKYVAVAVQHSSRNIQQMMDEQIQKQKIKFTDDDEEEDSELKQRQKKNINKIKQFIKTTKALGGLKIDFQNIPQMLLGRIEIYLFNFDFNQNIQKNFSDKEFISIFDNICPKGPVLDFSVCQSQSKLISLNEDKYIRFYDFSNNKFQCNLCHFFVDNPVCISIHPHGFYLAVGFKEGLKIYQIIEDDFQQIFSDIKGCYSVEYSQQGSLLASGCIQHINIYDSYSFQLLKQLDGHIGVVKELKWTYNKKIQKNTGKFYQNEMQLILTSRCSGGTICVWDVETYEKIAYHSWKQTKLQFQFYDERFNIFVDSYIDGSLRFFSSNDQQKLSQNIQTIDFIFTCFDLIFDFQVLDVIIFGTNRGTVRLYLWPFFPQDDNLQEYTEISCCIGPVSSIKHSHDSKYLFVGGQDGSISFILLQLIVQSQKFQNIQINELVNSLLNEYYMNDFILSSRCYFTQKRDHIKELYIKVQNLKNDIEDIKIKKVNDLPFLSQNNQEKRNIHEQLAKIEEFHKQISLIQQKKNELQINQKKEIEQMCKDTDQQLICLYNQHGSLIQNYQLLKQQLENNISQEIENNSISYEKEKKYLETQENYLLQNYFKTKNQLKSDKQISSEIFIQENEEYQQDKKMVVQKLQKELKQQQQLQEEIQANNTKLQKDCEKFLNRKDGILQMIQTSQEQVQRLLETKKITDQKCLELEKQSQQRENIINNHESDIKKTRSLNKTLKNFQQVFANKQNVMTEEKAQILDNIQNIDKNIYNIKQDLIKEHFQQNSIQNQFDQSKIVKEQLKKNLSQTQNKQQSTNRYIENIKYELTFIIKDVPPSNWLTKIKQIYKQFFELNPQNPLKNYSSQTLQVNQNQIQPIIQKKRDISQICIQNQKSKIQFEEDQQKHNYQKLQNENTRLVSEINQMKSEKKQYEDYILEMENELQTITSDLNSFVQLNYKTFRGASFTELRQNTTDISEGPLTSKNKYSSPYQLYKDNSALKLTNGFSTKSNKLGKTQGGGFQKNQQLSQLIQKISMLDGTQRGIQDYQKMQKQVKSLIYSDGDSIQFPQISVIASQEQEETNLHGQSVTTMADTFRKKNPSTYRQLKDKFYIKVPEQQNTDKKQIKRFSLSKILSKTHSNQHGSPDLPPLQVQKIK